MRIDPDGAGPHAVGGFNISLGPQPQGQSIGDPARRRQIDDADRKDRVGHAAAEDHDQSRGEQQRGKRHQHVDQPHHDAAKSRKQRREHPGRHAGDQRKAHHPDADEQRQPRAVDHAREDVAAELVGAEPVRGVWRQQPHDRFDLGGVVGRQDRRKESGRGHADKDAEPRRPRSAAA